MKNLLLTTLGIFGFTALSMAQLPVFTKIIGKDTSCISKESLYSVQTSIYDNQYLFRDTIQKIQDGTGFFALNTGYNYDILKNTFSYDLWVKPTRTITMSGESNVCAGDVSVPLANSNQNWAIVPVGLGGGEMSVGLTIGTNGLMVGEHSGNILVSRLSYSTPITDWVHVAIVYRTDSIFLYLNGNLVRKRITHCPSNIKRVTSGLTGYYYSPDFKGNVDEFRLWDIPLSSAQIKKIKNKKLLNKVDGLRYYASFDNGKFERTLGDIGNVNMTVSILARELNIKKNDWVLNSYTGSDINNLTAFSSGSFSYLWSTGSTSQTTLFVPTAANNELSVTVYNSSISKKDSIEITGINCSQSGIDTLNNTNGLIAYYPFNGNANDESGNNHNGTVVNAISDIDRFGNINSAYSFDGWTGIQRYISANIGRHDTISFSVWFKSKYPTTLYPDILTYGSENRLDITIAGNHPAYIENGSIGKIAGGAVVGGTWTPLINSNVFVADNLWHNAVICYVPNDSIYFYIDTKKVGAKKYLPNNPTDDLLYIGRQINDNAGSVMYQSHFNGSIDDISIYNRKLSQSEVTSLFKTDGLVAYYPFNGNANDESGNGNNGTPSGATLTTDRNGNANSAYQFNGTDNFIELMRPLPIENIFTLSYWAFNQNEQPGTVINDGSIDIGGNDFYTNMSADNIVIRSDKSGTNLNYQINNIQNIFNKWIQVVWVMTPDSSVLFVNGELIGQLNDAGTNTGFHDLTSFIGARKVWSSRLDEYFKGKIDDISIYNRALTVSEVKSLYKNTDGLVAQYPFNGNANDESGYGNNGTSSGATLTTDRHGNTNSAYQFNGTDNYIRLLNPLPIDSIFTFSFWAYSQLTGGKYGNIISDGGSQAGGNDFLLNMTDTRIGIRADKGGKPLNYEDSSPPELSNLNITNRWIHVVWVMNPNQSIVYLDGIKIAEINQSGTNTDYHDLNSFIGARQVWGSPDNFFFGKIDDIDIYNRALTADEVLALYQDAVSFDIELSSNPTIAGSTTGGGTYTAGSQVTVTAIPEKDCTFIIWTENGKIVSTDATYSFTATANRNLVANFALPQSTITTLSNPSYGGITYGEGIYETGTQTTVSVTPKPGYAFINWTENGVPVSTNPVYTFVVDSSRVLVANFLSPVGIKESNNKGIQVFPNPVSDKLNINLTKYSGLSIDEIVLLNSTGAAVLRMKTNDTNENIVIDIQGFMPGIYNLLISDKEKKKVAEFKIAVIH